MGAGSRGTQVDNALEFLNEKTQLQLDGVLNAWADGDDTFDRACFHLGKENVAKLISYLEDEDNSKQLEEEYDAGEMADEILERLKEVMKPL